MSFISFFLCGQTCLVLQYSYLPLYNNIKQENQQVVFTLDSTRYVNI